MLSVLNNKERAVLDTLTMRFHAPEALVYLNQLGMKMGIATYYRYRKKLEDMKLERMQFIAQHFSELHLEKIDRLELIDSLMWENYEKEKDPTRRVKILETIADSQVNLSSYYESSTVALEVTAKFNGNGNDQANNDVGPMKFDKWRSKNTHPRVANDSQYSDEENGQYYWDLHRRYQEYVKDWERENFGPEPAPDPNNPWRDHV